LTFCRVWVRPFALLAVATAVTAQDAPTDSRPLPNAAVLKQRALANLKQSEKALENYSCNVTEESDELSSNGSVNRHRSKVEEQFFVNGVEIDHTLSRDGKELTGGDARKEQERVDKEVKKYSNLQEAEKAKSKDETQVEMFLRALRYSNGHREIRDGRSMVVYDLEGDPNFHPKTIEERFAVAVTGRIWLDEESGSLSEVKLLTDKDVKIGGGLVASVHKGFKFHLVQQREPDGVWITKTVDGSGDARAALFLHPRFRFRQDLDACHLFSVSTQAITAKP
jgi:hypothetical protein